MSVVERPGGCDDDWMTIDREQSAVVVTIRGPIESDTSDRLSPVLDDLINDQGNVFVAVELPDVDDVPVETLIVLVRAAELARARNGRLTVATGKGQWAGLG